MLIDSPSAKDPVDNLANSTFASLHAAIASLNSLVVFAKTARASLFALSAAAI